MDFPRAQAILHCISLLSSQYRYSIKQYNAKHVKKKVVSYSQVVISVAIFVQIFLEVVVFINLAAEADNR